MASHRSRRRIRSELVLYGGVEFDWRQLWVLEVRGFSTLVVQGMVPEVERAWAQRQVVKWWAEELETRRYFGLRGRVVDVQY